MRAAAGEIPSLRADSTEQSRALQQRICDTSAGQVEFCDAGGGLPVLYFHGTGAGNDAVILLEQALISSRCRLIVPNRPGYFDTPVGSPGSVDHCAQLAAELLEQLQIDRVAVVGTSGGGMPAAAFVRRFPERSAALILQCAQSHRWDDPRWLPKGVGGALFLFRHSAFYPFLRCYNRVRAWSLRRRPLSCLRNMSGSVRLAADAEVMTAMSRLTEMTAACAARPAGIENDWRILVGDHGIGRASISCPTLIIHDREDPLVPFAHAEWSQAAIPGSELFETRGSGHLIWFGPDAERMHQRRMEFLRIHLDCRRSTDNPP